MHHIISCGSETKEKCRLNVIPNSKEAYLNLRAKVPVPGNKKVDGKEDKKLTLNFIDYCNSCQHL